MSLLALSRSLTSPALVGPARLSVQPAVSGVRWYSKRKQYGYEEGHDLKNEVRKENFWLKRNPPRKPWSDHKENKNLHPQVLAWGPVSQTPDWSYAETGDPGALNEKQINLRDENIRLAKEIFEAAQLVLKAKEFEKK